MKKLLLLILLFPVIVSAQQRLDNWDMMNTSVYKIVVNRTDTLENRFVRYDTAVSFAFNYTDTADVRYIDILPPKFKLISDYSPIDEVALQELILKDVWWQYQQDIGSEAFDLVTKATSIADSIRFEYRFGVQLLKNIKSPVNGTVSDIMRTGYEGEIFVFVEACLDDRYAGHIYYLDSGFIRNLGEKR